MNNSDYFKAEKISGSVTRIHGLTDEIMYLVEGQNKAVLIDAGIGFGNLRHFVDTLTPLPVDLVLTHAHIDHAGGACYFDRVYLNEAEHVILNNHKSLDKIEYLHIMQPDAEVPPEDIAPTKETGFMPLNDGDTFDLGGITLEMIKLPGHTPGSMCVLNREERSILLGDACNGFTFLFDSMCRPLSEYLNNLRAFKQYEDRYDKVYLSHGSGDGPKSIVDEVIKVCQEAIAGQAEDIPFNFMGVESGYIAKAMDMSNFGQRADGKTGNIVYNKNNL